MIGIGILGAYTSAYQDTALSLGKQLVKEDPLLPTGLQDAITPASQNLRNVAFIISLMALLIYGLIVYKWYIAILLPISTLMVIMPFLKVIFIPRPNTTFYKNRIKFDLEKRMKRYEYKGDKRRARTAQLNITKLEC